MTEHAPVPHTRGRHIAMPLGGIGTGNVAIGADGGLRQWQLHNIGNHHGDLPGSLFAVRVSQWEPPLDEVRVLQAPAAPAGNTRTPMVDDDHVPDWQRELAAAHGVTATTISATYPVARVAYDLGEVPLAIELEATTPLVPLDEAASSLPVAMFTFTLRNAGTFPVHGYLAGALQNAVGYDGVTPIDGTRFRGYGGNTNRVRRRASWTDLVMTNDSLPPEHPGAGSMALACDDPRASALPAYSGTEELLAFLRSRSMGGDTARFTGAPWAADSHAEGPGAARGPSPAAETWLGALASRFHVEPGESTTVRFLMAWHFPNRYVNFTQFGPERPEWGPTRFWIGNHYTLAHDDAAAVIADVTSRWDELLAPTRRWTDLLAGSALDATAASHLATQAVVLRSPTCFRTADGAFYGFEGVNGVSTRGHAGDVGGSCPLNCTHVWNYAQALARLFPGLEASMRATELDVMQVPERHTHAGAVPHRVLLPRYVPQMWDVPIGGPEEPALDGMLGVLLKTYREVRSGAIGLGHLAASWPRLMLLLDHVRGRWDPSGSGVLRGVQPSTHDIDLRGVNTFMGTLWLAALRACEEMALRLAADPHHADALGGATLGRELAAELHALFERGSAAYDEICFTGEYYRQVLEPDEPTQFQWGDGCLSDQLIGQWWAHLLDLGHVLPAAHVRSALRAVVGHNLRRGFDGWEHTQRVYADGDDVGLLMCTWPHGGRPEVATRYCDEVWSGVEYEVAAHCLLEGLTAEGRAILDGLWARHDGSRRNPFNEIECGDHYARSMAGWSVLEAVTGQVWDAQTRTLRVRRPSRDGAWWPVVLDSGWGRVVRDGDDVRLDAWHGDLRVAELVLVDDEVPPSHGRDIG
ncbi:protein of unknown function DUF608 [Beutenbergia cavernae DSM 12333]|uniref:Uncharacterized protein n=1 Tax=Beutenbergia cavernae (strain ATCC BAA-8 / DSM 12333 / CCUG 43141 / JCM 11478 / NBRC 16432 / NCIMB 13614 / HKI 0122) TaxID=471853 RepID=C5C455_BEUC1|nr:GH116 family glycosyl-hydrolase [Beutenbergia cavernae]ACQ79968.1 protein of unknown function DUF608 [Beutenbergia cavernae DSM 12333]